MGSDRPRVEQACGIFSIPTTLSKSITFPDFIFRAITQALQSRQRTNPGRGGTGSPRRSISLPDLLTSNPNHIQLRVFQPLDFTLTILPHGPLRSQCDGLTPRCVAHWPSGWASENSVGSRWRSRDEIRLLAEMGIKRIRHSAIGFVAVFFCLTARATSVTTLVAVVSVAPATARRTTGEVLASLVRSADLAVKDVKFELFQPLDFIPQPCSLFEFQVRCRFAHVFFQPLDGGGEVVAHMGGDR